jgi:hypothetical protein
LDLLPVPNLLESVQTLKIDFPSCGTFLYRISIKLPLYDKNVIDYGYDDHPSSDTGTSCSTAAGLSAR